MSHQGSAEFTFPLRQDAALSAVVLASMIERERTAYACRDYLSVCSDGDDDDIYNDGSAATASSDLARRPNRVTPDDRGRIVDWCYDVVDHCRLDRETVAIAMNALDRFLSAADGGGDREDALRDRARYQLVAVTALYVAVKLSHERGATFGSGDFAAMSHGTYAAEDIEAAERRLLRGLGWRLCPPTPLQIGYRILSLLVTRLGSEERGGYPWEFLHDETAFQTEVAVRDYRLATRRPSTVAAAAVANAVRRVDGGRRPRLAAALRGVLGELAFDGPLAVMEARERLRRLVAGDDDSTMPSTPAPVSDDDSFDSCATVH